MAGYELESVNLEVNIAADSNVSANITDAQSLSVTLGKAAELNVGQAVTYIESGRAELQPLVIAAAQSASEAETSAQNASDSATAALGYAERAEAAAESVVSDKSFVFEQEIPTDTWHIVHTLNKRAGCVAVDSAGEVQIPDKIRYVSDNEIIATFLAPFAGKAYLN